jgi:outer membrane protein assembly factor BamD
MNKIVYFIFVFIALTSCSEYQKAFKSEDPAVKLTAATNLYTAAKYDKAIRLFEQLSPAFKGKPQGEELFYMYSQSLFKTKQYYLAGYQFESFAALYPKSDKVQEAAFLSAKSYAQLSPEFSLDQVDTEKAVTKMQAFIDAHPTSTYITEANEVVKNLQEKLELKTFSNAKQYNLISDYKAAIKALDNFLLDFPGTSLKEKALFYKYDSMYQLAINSIESKMKDRLEAAKLANESLLKFAPNTEYKDLASSMLARIDKDLQKFSK